MGTRHIGNIKTLEGYLLRVKMITENGVQKGQRGIFIYIYRKDQKYIFDKRKQIM